MTVYRVRSHFRVSVATEHEAHLDRTRRSADERA